MGSRKRYHARYPQADPEYLRRQREARQMPGADAPTGLPLSEHRIVKMQHVIGNQAVQRLLAQRDIHADSHADVQRAPDANSDRPGALATLVLANRGKLRGGSRIAGHEGKIELLSLSLGGIQKPISREAESEEQRISITIVKYVDDTSPLLAEAMAKGEGVTSAQFEFIRFDAEGKAEVVHTLEHSEGLIASLQSGGSDSSGKAVETLTIEFVVKPKK